MEKNLAAETMVVSHKNLQAAQVWGSPKRKATLAKKCTLQPVSGQQAGGSVKGEAEALKSPLPGCVPPCLAACLVVVQLGWCVGRI